MLARLREDDANETDAALNEQIVEEIVGHGPVVRKVQILPRTPDQFIPDLEFDIEIYVSLTASIKNSRSFLSTGAIVLFAMTIVPSKDV